MSSSRRPTAGVMMIDDESMHIVNTKVDSKKKSCKLYVVAS